MNDLFIIASGAGLQDGLNPCLFMASAVFIALGQWLSPTYLSVIWFRVIFALVYAFSILVFNFGPGQIFVLKSSFMFIAKALCFILCIWAIVLGVLYFRDWLLLSRGRPLKETAGKKINFLSTGLSVACLIVVVLMIGALSTLWPIDKYILLLGNAALLKGQWQTVTPLLAVYTIVSMWPLWFLWAFLNIKNLRPSMLKIVCASVCFAASSCAVLIFK